MSTYKWTINLDKDKLAEFTKPAFVGAVQKLHRQFQKTVDSPVFEWNRTTYRKNGEIVGSIRNAIDTGELLQSQGYTIISPRLAKIEWEAPYTQNVFQMANTDLIKFTLERMK